MLLMSAPIIYYGFAYIVVGVLLYVVEGVAVNNLPRSNALNILCIATGCFAYSLGSCGVLQYYRRTKPKLLTAVYLANNIVRLLLAVVVLLFYAIISKQTLLLFSINLIIFYITMIVLSVCRQISIEHKKDNSNNIQDAK